MKAVIFNGTDKPLTLGERPVPALGQDEILVRVAFCGICGSDLHAATDPAMGLPAGTVMGHEFSGEVVATTSALWREGDRVCGIPLRECADCRPEGECRRNLGMLCPGNKVVGLAAGADGAFSEYVRIGAKHAVRLPGELTYEQGALAEPLAVAAHAIDRAGSLAGRDILIIGAGPIGLAVTLLAPVCGARTVVVSEPGSARRELALALGASATIDPMAADVRKAFRESAGANPAVIFECSGVPGMVGKSIELAAIRGTVVVVGVSTAPEPVSPVTGLFKEVSIHFALGYETGDFHHVIELMRSGRVDVRRFISRVIPIGDLPATFASLHRDNPGAKILVNPAM